jgi:hypothetical protein
VRTSSTGLHGDRACPRSAYVVVRRLAFLARPLLCDPLGGDWIAGREGLFDGHQSASLGAGSGPRLEPDHQARPLQPDPGRSVQGCAPAPDGVGWRSSSGQPSRLVPARHNHFKRERTKIRSIPHWTPTCLRSRRARHDAVGTSRPDAIQKVGNLGCCR